MKGRQRRPQVTGICNGGGCSGFSMGFHFDDAQDDEDTIIERAAVKLW